ncbi:aldose 1-epimerase [Halobacillus dabanensis]|uniref:Aldose 1-epimerase n=1 Tax=Halobacillus dabanensis TaxID=240302 RepID=A0A1I3RQ95_HALDA|nr:aldose epimerase family protein [Halobacillus dabanensis]SFJ47366.1 aldose 1-epimerase [Halobacillus dabanensis]
MKVTEEKLPNGWTQYTLINDKEMSVKVLNYGGIIKEINVPDNKGNIENVVLGYQKDEDYLEDPNFFGALIGRVAGRIAGSTFTINGKKYNLEANDGENHIHGGSGGFHKRLWETSTFQDPEHVGLVLTLQVPHLSDGYPGDVNVKVTYQLDNDNQLKVDYEAVSTQDTVLTLTNHTYFNLSGYAKRTIHDHEVKMPSKHFLELDEDLIPSGHVRHVEGTPFDFRRPTPLRTGIESDYDQNKIAKSGYDHYFLFSKGDKNIIEVRDHDSGRIMIVETDQSGVVMYTGNNLTDDHQLAEKQSEKYLGVCFETQGSPASLHHQDFPSIELTANTIYSQQTVFTFQNENH